MSKNTEPNKHCPNCQGTGEPNYKWNYDTYKSEIVGIVPCAICYADFKTVYDFTDNLITQFSGKQSLELSEEEQDLCMIGEDGQKYRRLLNWLWTHPPASGQNRNGFPVGSDPVKPRHVPRPPYVKKPKIPKMDHEGIRFIAWFAADVKPLLESWGRVAKAVKKNQRLPILHYIRVTPFDDGLLSEYTDLQSWTDSYVSACIFSLRSALLPARLVQRLLKECNKKGAIAFGFDPEDEEIIIVRHENSTWRIPTMSVDSYPTRKVEANQQRERSAA